MGLVIISESFLEKPWPLPELLRILAQPDKVLPVLYLMSFKDFRSRVAAQTQVRRLRHPLMALYAQRC